MGSRLSREKWAGILQQDNMEVEGLRWERLRDRWVERFWGKSGLDRVFQRNNHLRDTKIHEVEKREKRNSLPPSGTSFGIREK
jgi:hypothetical protein